MAKEMKTYFVVNGIIRYNGKILILKKAADDYNYPNRWSFCGGYIKEFEAGEDTIIREVKEETGLDGRIIKTGDIIRAEDHEKGRIWIIGTYLIEVDSDSVTLCHENSDFRWVTLDETNNFPFVPGRIKDLKAVGLE